jgi:hypothetical protein
MLDELEPTSAPMTTFRPIRKDAETTSVACLEGQRLDEVVAPDGDEIVEWMFAFGDCRLNVGGTWRLVHGGRIAVAELDHGQWFGLGHPLDARQRVIDAVAAAVVVDAAFDAVTGDLRVEFPNGTRLEVLTNSAGFECWTLIAPEGTYYVGTGGGEVVVFGPGDRA